jgi:hypothetical protein
MADPTVESPDVPIESSQSMGGTVGTQESPRPFVNNQYKQGGKVDLKDCKVTTHQKSKSSPNW